MIDIIPGVGATSAALSAERTRMEVVSQNIANADVTKGLDGKPYQRQQVVFATVLASQQSGAGQAALRTVQVARIIPDTREPQAVWRPGHPHADPNGMVAMPNINVHEEMADLMTASRAFEANLAVVKTARAMAMQTLSIGRRT